MTDLALKIKTEKKKGNLFMLNKFFGPREGEGIRQFVEEVKLLGEENTKILADGIRDKTFNY